MRIGMLSALVFMLLVSFSVQVPAGENSSGDKQASDIDLLGSYNIIIGDLGDRFDGWDDRDTRVYIRVDDGWRYHKHYFDNLPSAIFVLRELYGDARVVDIEVPEYAGLRHEEHGHNGHGMIDGKRAWYVWDYERSCRGGSPLILAFDSWRDADDEAYYRDAEVLDFEEVLWRLNRWAEKEYDHVYWRGWDRDRWRDHGRWDRAWDHRWDGHHWDHRYGWTSVELNLGDFTLRWEDDGNRDHRRDRSHGDDCEHCRDNDRGRDRGDRHDRGRGNDRGRRNKGVTKQTQEK